MGKRSGKEIEGRSRSLGWYIGNVRVGRERRGTKGKGERRRGGRER